MHPALLIGEIQLCIFNQISEKYTLFALARTCKAFTEAALDVLWRDSDSFVRLIQCMPQDLWTVERVGNSWGGLKHCTLKYSRRVRYIDEESAIELDDTCIIALCSPSESAPTRLLRNLVSLKWEIKSDARFRCLQQLLSPSLISLELFFTFDYQPSQELESPSQISFEICPSLKYLTVSDDYCLPPHALEGLRRSISQLQNLHVISWNCLGSEAILSLAQLPTLTSAAFEIPSDFSTYVAALPSRSLMLEPPFSRVRELGVTYRNLASVPAFWNYFNVGSEKIRLLSLGRNPSQPTAVRDLMSALGSSCSRDALGDLAVYNYSQDLREAHPLGIRELRPLLKFHRIRSLLLELRDCLIVIDDATLLEMVDAWPNISTLFLNKYGLWEPASHATPSGLIGLLERCTKLKRLSLPVDFSTIDSADFDLSTFSHSRDVGAQLEGFDLGPFNIEHPPAIAQFLAHIVPNCVKVSMMWPPAAPNDARIYEQRWSEVERIYRTYRPFSPQPLKVTFVPGLDI
ncbi:hypothetical protein BJ138DRAFT_1177552 [Hygrophoropsis aurantiaca]|uniref:Uncharacterized protein n=1 Tax=Hygrophoropsis aurantiaca TaxID=72124 RepID=A0ACB8ALH9_9AGAM|nr:hypothetical protein BJ138DRAFT_1177552 [Hygrophoropsis aurantiaca]